MATPIYNVPLLATSSSERTVINTSISLEEALHSSVDAFLLNTPPTTPANGYKAIVGAAPTGVWASFALHIAIYLDGWYFYPPSTKYGVQNDKTTSTTFYKYNGATWDTLTLTGGTGSDGHIIQDETTDLPAQPKLAFEGAGVTATNMAGRTVVTIPGGASAASREFLLAARNYYVATTGSDTNPGTIASPFATITKAVEVTSTLDLNIYTATIKVADGTYNGQVLLRNLVGAGRCRIIGNVANPSAVVLTNSGADTIRSVGISGIYELEGFQITNTTGNCIYISGGGILRIGNLNFGSCPSVHIAAQDSSQIEIIGDYSILGNAAIHIYAVGPSAIVAFNYAPTIPVQVNIPSALTFSTFALASGMGTLQLYGPSYCNFTGAGVTGTAGSRFNSEFNAVIRVGGAGLDYIPGSTAGIQSTGGQYA
jgi:hypothetical protein